MDVIMWKLMIFAVVLPGTIGCEKNTRSAHNNEYAAFTNKFGLELYKKITAGEERKNVVLSPLSVATVLAMTSLGARGNSLEQFRKLLNLRESSHEQFKQLSSALRANKTDRSSLEIANGVWVDQSRPIASAFKRNVSELYGTLAENVEFRNAEQARVKINKWVAGKTNDKITELLPADSISSNTAIVLANAIYFKGAWKIKFNSTEKMDFHALDGKTHKTDFMKVKADFKTKFSAEHELRILELPYTDTFSMFILMPNGEFSKFERDLNENSLRSALDGTRRNSGAFEVAIPKFTVTLNEKLNGILKEMGLTDVFDESKSDLSGIDGTKQLFVSGVYHQSYVAVDERGTEASAASAVVSNWRSMPPQPFIADRPFIFIIRDNNSGLILFVGRYVEPQTRTQ